jgi:hypothetical protein
VLSELNAYSILPESKAEIPAFCKLIAKIAHSFAVAKLGLSNFTPFLNPLIIKDELAHCKYYLGSLNSDEPPRETLHELNFLEFSRVNAIFVRVRLLCKLETPTYVVAVGTKK